MDKFTSVLEKAEERIRTKIGGGRKYPQCNKKKQKRKGKYERQVWKMKDRWSNMYRIGVFKEENGENGNK